MSGFDTEKDPVKRIELLEAQQENRRQKELHEAYVRGRQDGNSVGSFSILAGAIGGLLVGVGLTYMVMG